MIGKFLFPEVRKRLMDYYISICSSCEVSCCNYNISPITSNSPLNAILELQDIVLLEKALEFDADFKKIFKENIRNSMLYLMKKGFALDFFDYLKEHDYSVRSVVLVYRVIEARINEFNIKMGMAGMYENKFNKCLLLLPGYGCVFQAYRPLVCKLAFKDCFEKLELFDFVESHIRKVKEEELLNYIKRDFQISTVSYLPKIITGSSPGFKIAAGKFLEPEMKTLEIDSFNYSELADLADFIAAPFKKKDLYTSFVRNLRDKFLKQSYIEEYSLIFIDKLVKEKEEIPFCFGLECTEVFAVESE